MALTLHALTEDEIPAAAAVLGDGLRDNPIYVRAFGDDPLHRETVLVRLFQSVLRRVLAKGEVDGASLDGRLVGLCGRLSPGYCQAGFFDTLAVLPRLKKGNSWSTVFRIFDWAGAFAKRDPAEPHWHLGPVAVRRDEQGKGVGRALLKAFCDGMDATRATAYLETDTDVNVAMYERLGFRVVAREEVLGVACWFMSRPPGG